MPLFLGIDVGGTFLKGSILDTGSETTGRVSRSSGPELIFSEGGGATLDPAALIKAVKSLVDDLFGNRRVYEGILITGQMHGFVMVDDEGHPRTDIVTWRDDLRLNRDTPDSSAVLGQRLSQQFLFEVGNELRAGIPLAGIFTRLSLGSQFEGLTPHSLISFVTHSLCNKFSNPVMHNSDAAAHGFLNLYTNNWHESLLEECGISGLDLPRVTTNLEEVGKCQQTGLPVYVGVGDHQAALYGVGLEVGELSLNIATGSQVSVISQKISTNSQTRPYFEEKFLSTVTHIPAGRSLNVLMRLVGELTDKSEDELWKEIGVACEKQAPTELQTALSFFPNAQGSEGYIKNIRENEFNVGSLFNAAVMAMAENYDRFSRVVSGGSFPEKIVLSGGLVSRFKPLHNAIIAKFGASKIREVPSEDSSILGLLRLAKSIAL
jgi:xylulokinase